MRRSWAARILAMSALLWGCSTASGSITSGSETAAGPSATPSASLSSTPVVTPALSPVASVAPSSVDAPTPAASPMGRAVDLAAVLRVSWADRFETFGDELIRLESVWSPADLGLGGTCLPSKAWLECGLEDWLIQPSKEAQPGDYAGPRLSLFYAPGVRERLGRDLRAGEGPITVVGHFGDAASQDCDLASRDACRDMFVVTAIDAGA